MIKFGIMVGRLNPIHNGHVNIINHMLETMGPNNCLVLLGSCNNPPSLHNIFNYQQRKSMLQMIFPDVNVIGMPDFPGNNVAWFSYLSDLLKLHLGSQVSIDLTFFGGSFADVFYAVDAGYKTDIFNRYSSKKYSSSEVKDRLILGKPIDDLVPTEVEMFIVQNFQEFWKNKYKH